MKPIIWLFSLLFLFAYQANATAILHCPPDQTLSCTAQSTNLMAYGDAYVMKDGKRYSAGLAHVTNNINSACNTGMIFRKWQVDDGNGQIIQCTQTLTFQAGNFGITNITWPATELTLEGCDTDLSPNALPAEYQQPTYYHGLCNNIGHSYKDTEYIFGSDCKKIVRKWTILDWCSYNPNTGQGEWTFYQVFKLSNDSDPEMTCPSKLTVVAKDCDYSYVNLPLATASGESCTAGYVIRNNSIYADTTSADASGVYPVGDYKFSYEVEYGCGSKNYCETVVTVVDPRPVPYCLATINVVLMGVDSDFNGTVDEGMVDVWAKDVNLNSYHPCHNKPLTFSFAADSVVMSRTFTCEDIGRNNVNVYVSDQYGKQSYCRVHIDVQNNGANIPNCQPKIGFRPLLAGQVTNPIGQAIPGVLVSHRDRNFMSETRANGINTWHNVYCEKTDMEGQFSADEVERHRTYSVHAYKPGDVSLVDEKDLALLEAYIKGESSFKSSYTYLAADINQDGQVDINDFHLMKNLLGQEEAAWPNQSQWVFYTQQSIGYQSNTERPAMPENTADNITIEALDWGYGEDLNFIGILKGNLDYYEGLGAE